MGYLLRGNTCMARHATLVGPAPLHVSLVALPDAVISTLAGIFDVMNAAALRNVRTSRTQAPFRVEIVGESVGPLPLVSGVPIEVQRSVETIDASEIVIVPSMLL